MTDVESRLNLRRAPSTGSAVIGTLGDGAVVRNLGCRGVGDDRWCEVERPEEGSRGWMAGRYLRDAAPPGAPNAPMPQAAASEGTAAAETACVRVLAETAGADTSEIAVFDVLPSEAGIGVMMTLAGAERPWSCLSDAAGHVQGLTYTGEG